MTMEAGYRTGRPEGMKPLMRWFGGEYGLVLTGLLGFLLAGVCAVWILLFGETVAPGGNLSKAFSFNAALGIFLLSTAAILPYSAMGERGRAIFRWSYIVLALYSYFAENVQNFRGVNPRFVENGTPFDEMVGNLFTTTAMLLIVFYVYLAVYYFRRRAYELRPALVTGIRYAMLAILLSFVSGIWISVNDGRMVGTSGNIIVLHGLGFHALQAVPLVAWLAERASLPAASRMRSIHITGLAYLLGLLAVGWQTYLGHGVFEASGLPVVIFSLFLISILPGVQLLFRIPWGSRAQLKKFSRHGG
ncbi:hypothetical protein [Paenibacillus mucilaginosus]|uniref:Uncharacterized protein n=3 Tax=Paenibacillus mucilaginosus TaxID=61624 RepID=H6NMX5_9BACL|nr:hypothetical protein [Paenibacillus mucilaginosus]AEI43362.1 hypothetical membrane protein [Paenibacillus mucilaginosus KNP414]AFC31015.1 hypothetical protein PM3016_4243 [Paenibacillus mucilaginosus 3016]AFH63334.1 membrane protein [Paenibacillus mucilaginosus K02]MCG7212089.1 hypothetical protein [Paenibacillus mucilaginosus]WDM24931.1 hypothetical protein KCX80_20870 [Paenibacillus mucilaginosus]